MSKYNDENKNVPIRINNIPRSDVESLEEIVKRTGDKIRKGIEKKNAGTGTPIEILYGGAKFMAQMSNIGDGSKASGGGGVEEGLKTILEYKHAEGQLEVSRKEERNYIEAEEPEQLE